MSSKKLPLPRAKIAGLSFCARPSRTTLRISGPTFVRNDTFALLNGD